MRTTKIQLRGRLSSRPPYCSSVRFQGSNGLGHLEALSSSEIWIHERCLTLDPSKVLAPRYLHVASCAPIRAPRVSHDPVLTAFTAIKSFGFPPANNCNRVVGVLPAREDPRALLRAVVAHPRMLRLCVVNARVVCEERWRGIERHSYWAILVHLLHNLAFARTLVTLVAAPDVAVVLSIPELHDGTRYHNLDGERLQETASTTARTLESDQQREEATMAPFGVSYYPVQGDTACSFTNGFDKGLNGPSFDSYQSTEIA